MQQFECKLPRQLYRKLKVKHEREPKYLEPQHRIYNNTPILKSTEENQQFIFDDEKGKD
ncbi:MAG: hypothetical protein WC968_04635 [Bacilli bacterium]